MLISPGRSGKRSSTTMGTGRSDSLAFRMISLCQPAVAGHLPCPHRGTPLPVGPEKQRTDFEMATSAGDFYGRAVTLVTEQSYETPSDQQIRSIGTTGHSQPEAVMKKNRLIA